MYTDAVLPCIVSRAAPKADMMLLLSLLMLVLSLLLFLLFFYRQLLNFCLLAFHLNSQECFSRINLSGLVAIAAMAPLVVRLMPETKTYTIELQ